MEQLDYNILFRWFVGLDMDEPIGVPTVFTKNRDRLLTQEVARSVFRRVAARAQAFMSDEHFTVDGTLIEAWPVRRPRKDGPPDEDGCNFHGQVRTNDTHASKTDPDAKLYRKSNNAEARVAYLGHVLIENRHGLIVDAMATVTDSRAEREAGLLMLQELAETAPSKRRTVGADKNYDTTEFVTISRELNVTPHVSQNLKRTGGSAVDGRTTRHPGYAQSNACRPRVERPFGWMKAIGWIRKVKLRGLVKVDWLVVFASAAFNLRRLTTLTAAPV